MLVYPDHPENKLALVHGLLIVLILVSFWLSETGQVWGFWQFSSQRMAGMAENFTCWCILTTFSMVSILVMVYWFSSFWSYLDLGKPVKCAFSGHFLENAWGEWANFCHTDVSWPPSDLIWFWNWHLLSYQNHPDIELGYPCMLRSLQPWWVSSTAFSQKLVKTRWFCLLLIDLFTSHEIRQKSRMASAGWKPGQQPKIHDPFVAFKL